MRELQSQMEIEEEKLGVMKLEAQVGASVAKSQEEDKADPEGEYDELRWKSVDQLKEMLLRLQREHDAELRLNVKTRSELASKIGEAGQRLKELSHVQRPRNDTMLVGEADELAPDNKDDAADQHHAIVPDEGDAPEVKINRAETARRHQAAPRPPAEVQTDALQAQRQRCIDLSIRLRLGGGHGRTLDGRDKHEGEQRQGRKRIRGRRERLFLEFGQTRLGDREDQEIWSAHNAR